MYIYTVCSVAHLVTPVYLYKVVFFATVCVCGVGCVCVCYVFCHVSPQCVAMYAVILVCPLYTCE